MDKLIRQYEAEIGEKALYRMRSSDYHTLRYVRWLEKKLSEWTPETDSEKMKQKTVLSWSKKHGYVIYKSAPYNWEVTHFHSLPDPPKGE